MKTLYENEWLNLMETDDGYVYSHESRCNGQIVAILIYKHDDRDHIHILGRFEDTPCHNEGKKDFKLVSFTGGVEKGQIRKTAIMEAMEEAGLEAKDDELKYLGYVRPSKSTDTFCYLFAIDASNKTLKEAKGDGSEGEKGAYTKWVSSQEALSSQDPLMVALCGRFDLMLQGELSAHPYGPDPEELP